MTEEVFTLTGPQLRTLVESDPLLIGALPSGGPNSFTDMSGTRRQDFVALPPLEGPTGIRQSWHNPFQGVNVGAFVIPSAGNEPDLAMRLADYLFSTEAFKRGRYGVPGRDWREPPPGAVAWDGTVPFLELTDVAPVWGQPQNVLLMNRHAFIGLPSHSTMDNGDPWHLERILWDATVHMMRYNNSRHVPVLSKTVDEASEFTGIMNSLHPFVELSVAEFVTGARCLDNDWDSYLATLESIGYRRLMELNQIAFDRQWADSWTWVE